MFDSMEKAEGSLGWKYNYYLGPLYGTSEIGKIVIEEGNALEVNSTTVILLPYEGMK